MIAGGTPRRAYVIDGDESLAGAFTARVYRAESAERIVRIDSVATTNEAAERELYEWLSHHPQEFNGADAIDVWLLCSEPRLVADFGFTHSRTYLRMDLPSLNGIAGRALPKDISIIGPDDDQARMVDWARLYNEAFTGEWRHALIRDIEMRQQVLGAGRHSIAGVDQGGRTISLVLVQLENRPQDPLPQPSANIAIVCTEATRRHEGIGEGLLRASLQRAGAAGTSSPP